MLSRDGFRERLIERILAATGVSSTGLALAAACGGHAEIGQVSHTDGKGDATGAGTTGAGGSGGAGRGGTGTGGNNGSAGGTIGAGGFLIGSGGVGVAGALIDAGVEPPAARVCVAPHDGGLDGAPDGGITLCDEAKRALAPAEYYGTTYCRGTPTVTFDGPKMVGVACCYDVYVSCFIYVGRAFLVDEGLLKAPLRRGSGWHTGPSPCTDGLSEKTRQALCDAWVKDGLFEHASVATFARFAMQLLAVGAPSRLLHETLAAGRDEIRHAELCFALASAYAGEPLEPDRFPIEDDVRVNTDLAAIVEETAYVRRLSPTRRSDDRPRRRQRRRLRGPRPPHAGGGARYRTRSARARRPPLRCGAFGRGRDDAAAGDAPPRARMSGVPPRIPEGWSVLCGSFRGNLFGLADSI